MEQRDLVSGEGWISSDSSLYGDDDRQTTDPTLSTSSNLVTTATHSSCKVSDIRTTRKSLSNSNSSRSDQHLIGRLNQWKSRKTRPLNVEHVNPHNEDDGNSLLAREARRPTSRDVSWQLKETKNSLPKCTPDADPAAASMESWLWAHDPKVSPEQGQQEASSNISNLVRAGSDLLRSFDSRTRQNHKSVQRKSTSQMQWEDRQLAKLKDDILSLAAQHGITCGKWMLFPSIDSLHATWRIVAEAIIAGKLGPSSKVGMDAAGTRSTLICVYTYDFRNTEDVRRVLLALAGLGLIDRNSRPVHYKCDAYTYLGIDSKNQYKLKASLFSSRDFL